MANIPLPRILAKCSFFEEGGDLANPIRDLELLENDGVSVGSYWTVQFGKPYNRDKGVGEVQRSYHFSDKTLAFKKYRQLARAVANTIGDNAKTWATKDAHSQYGPLNKTMFEVRCSGINGRCVYDSPNHAGACLEGEPGLTPETITREEDLPDGTVYLDDDVEVERFHFVRKRRKKDAKW